MGWRSVFTVALLAAALGILYRVLKPHEVALPKLDPDPWWGPGERGPEDTSIVPFKIDISQKDVDDLNLRLNMTQYLVPPLEGANFTYGMNSVTLLRILQYWKSEYKWKEREDLLNAYPHFKTQVEGIDIHFLHAKPEQSDDVKVLPLLLIHGWPGSFVEFYGILPHLTKPHPTSKIAFEVICPSIPGYGFSQGSSKPGLGRVETAQIFLKLMKRLGYEKFYVQGGDWGAAIAGDMATLYRDNVLGVHVNMLTSDGIRTPLMWVLGSILPNGWMLSAEDNAKVYPVWGVLEMLVVEMGYLHIQGTKPDTIGVALSNSPLGLAAYILEKFSTWTDMGNRNLPDGGLNEDFPIQMDQILDNICIYWFTRSIQTSVRYYAEAFSKHTSGYKMDSIPIRVPAGLACFPNELLRLPKLFAANKFYDIVSYTDMSAGGHFAAMERPAELARDIHEFVAKVVARVKTKPSTPS